MLYFLCSKLPLRSVLEIESASIENSTTASSSSSNVLANQACTSEVLLQTLVVMLQNGNHKSLVRALIDTGSQKSYILKSTAENLGFKYEGEEEFVHSLFGGSKTKMKLAENRLESTKRKLIATGKFEEYQDVLDLWLSGKIIEEVNDDKENFVHYLPHRPVIKENSTKLERQPDNFETMVLGLIWNLKDDCLSCNIKCQKNEASNCILFGDFNATHNAWNCKNNTTRGRHLFNFANMLNLNIAFPSTPTRFGHNSANTIDIALIKNFYYPFTINSIDDLSSDHNPVFLNFNFKLAEAPPNPRAVSTDWKAFKINLNKNLSLFDFHPNNINNTNDLEQKITEFTEAVIDTHSHTSRPIETDRRNFTPHNINQLIKIKNYFRKRYHQTLNPIFKSHYNRAQSDLKKNLKNIMISSGKKDSKLLTPQTIAFKACKKFSKIKDQKFHLLTVLQLSAKPKNSKTFHPDEEPQPRLPDSIARPIAIMPLSRMENTNFAMPSIIDSHDMGLRTVYSPDAQKKTPIQRLFLLVRKPGSMPQIKTSPR
ncbi:putative RNA-directed DNA polymerase from transposon X-element [Trichonephila clavipes]|nr:putative RNA-directed DNA polymerase from transposon X-element [Trichonephila clavipes]